MSISKIFIPNFVCVLTNERYKTYKMEFSLCHLGHAPGVGLWGALGAEGVNFFFKHGHVAYQIFYGVQTSSPFPSRSAHVVTAKGTSVRIIFFTKYLKPKFIILKLHTYLLIQMCKYGLYICRWSVKASYLLMRQPRNTLEKSL